MDNNQKQDELDEMLIELSKNQEILKNNDEKYVDLLKEIYCNGFRHMYSNFYAVLTKLDTDAPGSIDILGENVGILYGVIIKQFDENDEVHKGVKKLYDHINLDISRINYLRGISNDSEELKNSVAEESKKSRLLMEKAQKMQREYVTILGIFASIIVAFFSGVGFSSAVLSNIHKVSVYRLAFMTILLAIILFNLLVVLMNFIRDMVSIEHNAHGKTVRNFNVILVLLLIVIVASWAFDLVGWRNIHIFYNS